MPRLVDGLEQVFTNLGIIGAGYKLFFFETTTTTPKTTYSDVNLTIPNPNPVVCDANGRPEYDIWGSDPATYKMVLATPDSTIDNINPIHPVDPINNLNAGSIIVIDPLPTAYWGLTSGTSTAYTLNPALVPITSYNIKYCFFIDIHTACGANPTLDINTIGAVSIKKKTGQGTKASLQAGDLQPGRYNAFYDGNDFVFYNTRGEPLYLGSTPTQSIVSGVVILSNISASYAIDTEGAASTDDLTTINGGADGQAIFLTSANSARKIVIKNATGNIILANQADFTLDVASVDNIILKYDGTNWREIARSNMVPGLSLLTGDATTSNNSGYAKVGVIDVGGVKKDLIWQWGITASVGQDGNVSVTFPLAFTSVFRILATHMASTPIGSGTWGIPFRDTNGFSFYNGGDATGPACWDAIGII